MNHMKRALVGLFMLSTIHLSAQEVSSLGFWQFFLVQKNLSEKVYLHNELRYRVIGQPDELQQFLVRPSAHYTAKKWLELSGGYTYAINGSYAPFGNGIDAPEHNTWEQIATKHSLGNLRLSTRFRYENRWVGSKTSAQDDQFQFSFSNRFRSMVSLSLKLSDSDFLGFYDEAFWISSEDRGVFVHQNWYGVSFKHDFSNRLSGTVSYMTQYLDRSSGNASENNLILRVGAKLKF